MVEGKFFHKSFEQIITSATENDDNKIVIILGSGYHRQYLEKHADAKKNICFEKLYDWQKLLEPLYKNYPFSGHYLKDFEDVIIKTARGENSTADHSGEALTASKIENECLKCIQRELIEAQGLVMKNYQNEVSMWLFNPKIVSDVISLNFDLLPEMLMRKEKTAPRVKTKDALVIKGEVNITRHRIVNGIKFWHPHGDIDSSKSMVLSLRKYGWVLNQVERLRKNFKANKKKDPKDKVFTWYSALAVRPVLVVGASISQMEWDIWFALANRKRNFAKPENKSHEQPIFKMTGPCETLDKNWFSELTIRKETYPSQWKHLQDLFNKY